MRRHTTRYQRTLAHPAEVRGIGFLTGQMVTLHFLPAPADSGVTFVRTDRPNRPTLAAHINQVTGWTRRTIIGHPPEEIGLVEHVMAALAGLHIDNCIVELDAPEPPGLDGSARAFVDALQDAGIVVQLSRKEVWRVDRPVILQQGQASLALHPSHDDQLTISYFLDYGPLAPIVRQVYTQAINPMVFAAEIAPTRTFLLESEAMELRKQGLGSRTTTADLLVFGPHGPIDNTLRFGNEPARHKVLDVIGDLALLGVDLIGHVIACRSGHPLNIELVRTLHQQMKTSAVPVRERQTA